MQKIFSGDFGNTNLDQINELIHGSVIEPVVESISWLSIWDDLHEFSKVPGVYILYFKDIENLGKYNRDKYIGASSNIKRRIMKHRSSFSHLEIDNFNSAIILKTKNVGDAFLLESWLIDNLPNTLNRARGVCLADDIDLYLKDRMSQRKKKKWKPKKNKKN